MSSGLGEESDGQELLVGELGRINSELAAERRLTAMVAHDLATPVQVIIGLSEILLEDEPLSPSVRRRLEQILRSAEGVASLVGDLRLGVTPGAEHLQPTEVDLDDLVSGLVERTRLLARSKDIRLDFAVDTALGPCTVTVDRDRLERALTNLIGNAIKFGPRHSVVRVAVERLGTVVRLTVSDEGPGIEDGSAERIFEVFHREERTSHLPGLGLGLYITRQIIEAHRGSVSVDRSTPSGAAFVVHLPLAASELFLAAVDPGREN